jgi:hypothetical protein
MDVLHAIRSNATEVMDAGAQPHAAYASFTCAALSWIVFLGVLHKVVASALHDRSCSWLKGFDAKQLHGLHSRVVCSVHCIVSAGGAAYLLKNRFVGGLDVFDIHPSARRASLAPDVRPPVRTGGPEMAHANLPSRAHRHSQASPPRRRPRSSRWRSAS